MTQQNTVAKSEQDRRPASALKKVASLTVRPTPQAAAEAAGC